METKFSKMTGIDKVIMIAVYTILIAFMVAIILPMVYIILASFIDPVTLQNQGLTFDFSKWTLTAYERVMSNSQIWIGFKNALIYSVLSTIIAGVVTLLAAYPMSRPDFKGRGFFNIMFVITMYFGGGLIPTYLLISNLNMLDTIWAILIPGAFSVWNMIIARTYYMGIPRDMQEAAEIDGASEMVYFFKILLPLVTPIIATISMWNFVGMWNSYFDAMIYLNDAAKQPLQLVLRVALERIRERLDLGRQFRISCKNGKDLSVVLAHELDDMRERAVPSVLIYSQEPYDRIEIDLGRHREEILLLNRVLVDVQHHQVRNLRGVGRVLEIAGIKRIASEGQPRVVEVDHAELRLHLESSRVQIELVPDYLCQIRVLVVVQEHRVSLGYHLLYERSIYGIRLTCSRGTQNQRGSERTDHVYPSSPLPLPVLEDGPDVD